MFSITILCGAVYYYGNSSLTLPKDYLTFVYGVLVVIGRIKFKYIAFALGTYYEISTNIANHLNLS